MAGWLANGACVITFYSSVKGSSGGSRNPTGKPAPTAAIAAIAATAATAADPPPSVS